MIKHNVIKTLSFALLIATISALQSCTKSSSPAPTIGDWVFNNAFGGGNRSNAVAFGIGGNVYYGTGFSGTFRYSDFWQYNPATGFWTQLNDVPNNPLGPGRSEAIGFSIESSGKGYVGLGYDGINLFKDFYEFDPAANSWTQKADFGTATPALSHPPLGRYGAVAFSMGNYGYVGTGYDNGPRNDFYKYDPSSDTWSQIAGFPGNPRMSALAFVANKRAYVGTGISTGASTLYQKDFYAYDTTINTSTGFPNGWVQKASLENGYDLKRYGAAAFALNDRGYLTTGTYTSPVNTTWEYITDNAPGGLGQWVQKGNFEGAIRTGASGVSINNGTRGFVIGGKNGNTIYNDLWEFFPFSVQE
ncbi:MAG TPA: kelch repeat-containing protein [Cytophagaceae bacterium]|nr:kelch repeat-containing protein [Cytophagaceae bacterium]